METTNTEELQEEKPSRVLTLKEKLPVFAFIIFFYISLSGTSSTISSYIEDRVIQQHNLKLRDNFTYTNLCVLNRSDPAFLAEQQLKQLTSPILKTISLCSGIPNILVVFIYGALSDRYGKRLFFAVALGGLVISNIIDTLFANLNWPYMTKYIASVINGLGGSSPGVIAITMALIIDTVAKERRLLVIALFEGCKGLGSALGGVIAGAILNSLRAGHAMIIFTVISAVGAIFIYKIIELPREDEETEALTGSNDVGSKCSHIIKAIDGILLFSRTRTICLLLILVSLAFTKVTTTGSHVVSSLYLKDHPFCWLTSQIKIFNIVSIVAVVIGAIAAVAIIRRRLSLHNYIVLSYVSGILMFFFRGLGSEFKVPACNVVVIMGAICGIFAFLVVIILRAVSAHLVGDHEHGAVYGLLAISDVIAHSFGAMIIVSIYTSTMLVHRGLVFYLGSCFLIIALGLMTVFRVLSKELFHYGQVSENSNN